MIRKVLLALLRIRQWPNEIEADLAFRGIDIGWWHRNTLTGEGVPRLSSRRLLLLLDELPETSAYKTMLRDGQWPLWQRMLKTLTNETSLHRAGLYAGGDASYEPMVYVDPIEQRERAEEAQAVQEFHAEAEAQLYNRFGWT